MIIDRLFRRDNNATSPTLDQWIWEDYARKSTSGVSVTKNSAMGCAAYLRAITFISDTFAAFPIDVQRRLPNGDKEDASSDHRYNMLHNMPNPETTSFTWRQMAIGNYYNNGNCYAEIVRNGAGIPVELWPIPADKVKVERGPDKRIRYVVRHGTEEVILPYDDVLHIKAFSYDGYVGVAILDVARDVIGSALAQQEFASLYFANGAVANGMFKTAIGTPKDVVEKYQKAWSQKYSGENKHKTAFLPPGLEYQQLSMTNEQSQFIEAQNFSVKQIANLFGLPVEYLNDNSGATHSNVEQRSIDLVRFLFNSLVKRWEQEINTKLFTGTDLYCEFNLDYLLRGDAATRNNIYHNAILDGWMTKNEVRRLENLPPVEGGDVLLTPLNSSTDTTVAAEEKIIVIEANKEPETETTPDTNAINYYGIYEPILLDATARIIAKETKQIHGLMKKAKQGVKAFSVSVAEYYADPKGISAYVKQVMTPIASSWVAFDVDRFASQWVSSSKGQLMAVLNNGQDTWGDLLECLDSWETTRAQQTVDQELCGFDKPEEEEEHEPQHVINVNVSVPEQPAPVANITNVLPEPKVSNHNQIDVHPTVIVEGEADLETPKEDVIEEIDNNNE